MTAARRFSIMFFAFAMATLLNGCERPISDAASLKTIRAEAMSLMVTFPAKPPQHYTTVPKDRWPETLARLAPESVTVHEWGVDVLVKPYFDGGWGYHVSDHRGDLPMLDGCYSEVSKGIYWHGPC